MESLGMTYKEVLHTSYPLLLALNHDKPRVSYKEEEKKELSGKEMLKRKR